MSTQPPQPDLSQPIRSTGEYSETEIQEFLEDNVGPILESAGIPMRIVSPDFEVLMQNSRMEEMGGITQDEMATQGFHCYDQFSNDDVCGTENCTLKQLADQGAENVAVEVPKQSYDGEEYQVEVTRRTDSRRRGKPRRDHRKLP